NRLSGCGGMGNDRGGRALAPDQVRPADDAGATRCRRGIPGASAMKTICLFCGSNIGARAAYAQAAGDLGRALAARGITLVYGGGSVGLMQIAAQAALDAGGKVIGVITEQLMVR